MRARRFERPFELSDAVSSLEVLESGIELDVSLPGSTRALPLSMAARHELPLDEDRGDWLFWRNRGDWLLWRTLLSTFNLINPLPARYSCMSVYSMNKKSEDEGKEVSR